MDTFKFLLLPVLLVIFYSSLALAQISSQIGAGFGKEIRGNKNLTQYDLFWREALTNETPLGDNWNVSVAMEFGLGLIRETADDSEAARLTIMPQVILTPHEQFNFIFGLGAGCMAGETEFANHNLGGTFLLASKVGMQFLVNEHFGIEYGYYHQSNGGVYTYNASLNMHQLAITYAF